MVLVCCAMVVQIWDSNQICRSWKVSQEQIESNLNRLHREVSRQHSHPSQNRQQHQSGG